MDKKRKIRWKQVGMHSIKYFIIIIAMFLITFVFVAVGLAIYHSILVEVVLTDVFTSLASSLHVTVPISGLGAIFLAFTTQLINKNG